MISCDAWIHRPFSHVQDSVAYFTPSTTEFDAFRGVLLDRPEEDSMNFPFRLHRSTFNLTHSSCESRDGWYYERVGPFRSQGGYDWWSVYWNDFGGFRERLQRGDQVGIVAHVSTPVDEGNRKIPLPPIHVHHVHVTPSLGLHNRFELMPECAFRGRNCLDASMLIQHHGDAQCDDPDRDDCMRDDYMGGIKEVRAPLSVFGHFNDVRPLGSDVLEWYYLIGVKVTERGSDVSKRTWTPLSEHAFGQPGTFVPWQLQSYVVTSPIPRRVYTAFYEVLYMPFSGTLWRFQVHAHQAMFLGSDLFAGGISSLGLDRLSWEGAWANITTLRQFVRTNVPPDSQKCVSDRNTIVVGTKEFDRRTKVHCDPWTFAVGDAFTVVSYHGPSQAKSSFEGMKGGLGRGGKTAVENDDLFPQHVSWFLEYYATDHRSHYTYSWGSKAEHGMDNVGTLRDTFRLVFHFGTPESPPTLTDEVMYASSLLLWSYLYLWVAVLVLLVLYAAIPFARPILIGMHGLFAAGLYLSHSCVYAFNSVDAGLFEPFSCTHPSWGSVALLILGIHVLPIYFMTKGPPPKRKIRAPPLDALL
jgi:hypothetical protein